MSRQFLEQVIDHLTIFIDKKGKKEEFLTWMIEKGFDPLEVDQTLEGLYD